MLLHSAAGTIINEVAVKVQMVYKRLHPKMCKSHHVNETSAALHSNIYHDMIFYIFNEP